jgi:hypothetical protein
MLTPSSSRPAGSYRRTLPTMLGLLTLLMLSAGCPKRIVLPDTNQVHQLSRDVDVEVWCHGPDGSSWTRCKVRASNGWWLAPPSVVRSSDLK